MARPAQLETAAPPRVSVWNAANALTALRLLLVPVFAVVLLDGAPSTGRQLAAFAIFAVAAGTDRLDGELARRRNLITDVGKIADPIADKALVGAALVGLSVLHELAWWATAVILVRELAVTLLRLWVVRIGVIPASRGGKVKTTLQVLTIGGYLLPLPGILHPVLLVLLGATLLVTVATAGDYVVQALRLHAAGRRRTRTGSALR